MSDIVIIVCTRYESTRLPGKALMPIAGVPALGHILARLRATGYPVLVATPWSDEQTDAFDAIAKEYGARRVYGDNDSPLHRMAELLLTDPVASAARWVVRVTHDDILVDPETIVGLVQACRTYEEQMRFGYAYTPKIVEGAGVEVIHRDNLLAAAAARKEPTEYVSYFVRGLGLPRPNVFVGTPRAAIARPYRLTLDYPADATVLEIVLRELGPDATADAVCAWLDAHPDVLNWNRLPILSVYTCAHNAERWIGEAVRSVLARSLSLPIEYVVVDDGSTDRTRTEVSKFADDTRLRFIISPRNEGLASASNRALAACRAPYVMRLDADDVLLPNAFYLVWKYMLAELERGAAVVYTGHERIGPGGEALGRGEATEHHVGGAVFDKRILNELRFRDGLRHWDGLELFTRLRDLRSPIAYSLDPTWLYRQHPGSLSRSEPSRRAALRAAIEGGKLVTDKGGA